MEQIAKLSDIIGIEQNMDFSHWQHLLAYSIGCVIVIYNMKTNRKTFINYHSQPIAVIKLINEGRILITIDQSVECNSVIILWNIATMQIIVQFTIETGFKEIKPLFLFRINRDRYIILIGNLIHMLSLENINSISCDFYTCLRINDQEANDYEEQDIYYDCKAFLNSNTIALISRNSLLYARLEPEKNQLNPPMITIIFQMKFPFNLIRNSLRISSNVNWIAFLTEKGSCLLYDQNGNSKHSINPLEQDSFSCCEFYSDMIIFGSNYGNIYSYNFHDSSLLFIISPFIIKYKERCFYNQSNHNDNQNKKEIIGASIEAICLTEGNDLILIKSKDNSILLSQLSILIQSSSSSSSFSGNKINDHPILNISFAHFDIINSICWSPSLSKPSRFYSCGQDQNLICYTNNKGHWLSSYFDIEKLFNSNNNNFTNKSTNKTVLTVIKIHPRYSNKLFAGDNKGNLYLFDIQENRFQYNKEIVINQSIESLSFSLYRDLISIGFDNGMNVICDIESNCSILLRLIDGFYSLSDIEFRRRNGHILSSGFFCSNDIYGDNVLVYNKGKKELEITSICYDNIHVVYSSIIKVIAFPGELLDFSIHSSKSYIIALIDNMQIVVVHLIEGNITAGIDLRNEVSYAYMMKLDSSGLYLVINCDFIQEDNKDNENRRDGIVMYEIGTGKIKGMIKNLFKISSIDFSPDGDYIAIGGQNGCMSIWKLSDQIHESIVNVLIEMKRDRLFWYQYEIAYQLKQINYQQSDKKPDNHLPFYYEDNRNLYNPLENGSHKEQSNKQNKDSRNQLSHPLRGELITIENVFAANADTKRKKQFDKEEKAVNDLFHKNTIKGNNDKLNYISSIQNKSIHSFSNIEKINNELKEPIEEIRINDLKEQLTYRGEENEREFQFGIGNDKKLHVFSNNDSQRKEFEYNKLQIDNIKQISLDGNKGNYIPMKIILKDPTNFALFQMKKEERDNETHKKIIYPPQNEIENYEDRKETQSSAKKSKIVMPKIEKPIKPVLPYISFTNDNAEHNYRINQQFTSSHNVEQIDNTFTQMQLHNLPKEDKRNDEIDLKSSQLTFGGNISQVVNVNNPHIYPEPEDIDDDFNQVNTNNKHSVLSSTHNMNNNTTNNNKLIQNEANNKLSSSIISDSIHSIADDIDYFNDNITHFDSMHKLK